MITFKKISWKNFLSTGNHPIKVELDEQATTLIIGSNGAGKSTILDALTFVLYGKSFRKINKSQLINTTNEKNCEVEIEFSVNTTEWKIVRGIKPNIFKITKDGKDLNESSHAADQQKWLEQNVLKMNYKSFTQIVILGSSTFVPFMQLTAVNRREVIEDLLDIKIFSAMSEVVKAKLRSKRDEVRTLELKKDSLIDKVEMQENFIKTIEATSHEDIKKKQHQINEIAKEAKGYIDKNDKLSKELENLDSKLLGLSDVGGSLKKLSNYELY